MKNSFELLRQKEADLARVRREIESLQVVTSLLSDDSSSDPGDTEKDAVAEATADPNSRSEATGTDGLFSAIPVSRPSLWNVLKRGK